MLTFDKLKFVGHLFLPWIEVTEVREQTALTLASGLGRGEREVPILAEQTPHSLVSLDDTLARQQARILGLTFTGTLGILLKAKQAGQLAAIAPDFRAT